MKLKDFPLVMRAFLEIEMDSGGSRHRKLIIEKEIDDYWLVPFRTAEQVFLLCSGTTISVLPGILAENYYAEDTPLWQVVTMPVNEDDWRVYRYLGVGDAAAWVTSRLLYEFFDGELSGVFTGERE